MDKEFIDSLTQEQRATWGFPIFIRMWLSGMCQSRSAQNWTIGQLAILFEVTQAHLFREDPHTVTSISKELNMPIQTVSRNVRDLQKMGLVVKQEASNDARKEWLCPSKEFFTRDAMPEIAREFASDWYHGWKILDKANGSEWYSPMSSCTSKIAKEEIKQFRELTKDN